MTHHSYLTQLNREELKNNKIQVSYKRNGREPLRVGETYPFFMDSGFGCHEYIIVQITIEQRHLDNPFELVYDIINKIVSDAKHVIDCLESGDTEDPIMKRCISLHNDPRFSPDIEMCEDLIRDVSVTSYKDKLYNDPEPDINYYGICVEEFGCMDERFQDIDYISECQGVLVILLGRNEVGMKHNIKNVDWYGMDFDGYSKRPQSRIDSNGNTIKIKRELDLVADLAVVLRSEKGWKDVVKYYISVIRRVDVKRAKWIQSIFNKALKLNNGF